MAKNIGPIQFTGKLGGISGRSTSFGNILQTPGGFKGERIKTEDRYIKTRQLNSEFSRCAKISSVLYKSLGWHLKTIPDTYVYGHIQGRICAIKECDEQSPKGEKTVAKGLATQKGQLLLRDFSFNRKRDLTSALMISARFSLAEGRLSLPQFDVSRAISPRGAKHLGLQLVLLRLDTETPAAVVALSEMVFMPLASERRDIVLQTALPEGEGMLIGLLYAGFCGEDHGELFWRRDWRNSLGVVGVEV